MAETKETISFQVNGVERELEVSGSRNLLSVLRHELGLTGAKYGCGVGECGSCTVLLDGRAVRSCVVPVSTVAGRSVTTIEGLGSGDRLHPVQEAFLETQAFQCGYCTPGLIMSVVDLLQRKPDPTEPEIRDALAGNLCRCAPYPRIIRAAQLASATMSSSGERHGDQ
jgi:aerobic-type carbon monoxide dehydrogenase small subunit (CoxS/CutS family)